MATLAPVHVGPWTECDLLAFPEDGQRHELVEGSLLTSPPPAGRHQIFSFRLARLLDDSAPADLQPVEGLGVRVPGGSILVPDILVADRQAVLDARSGILDAETVRLVVEIVSPGSATMDRLTKPAIYARARIPDFWRGELDRRASIATFHLEASRGVYVAGGTAREGRSLEVQSPFALPLNVSELLPL